MITLTIDTAGTGATVTLTREQTLVGERRIEITPIVSRSLLGAIEELLGEQSLSVPDIDRIVVQAGPARRTSALRAGVTVANLLAYAGGAELTKMSSGGSVAFVAPQYP